MAVVVRTILVHMPVQHDLGHPGERDNLVIRSVMFQFVPGNSQTDRGPQGPADQKGHCDGSRMVGTHRAIVDESPFAVKKGAQPGISIQASSRTTRSSAARAVQ